MPATTPARSQSGPKAPEQGEFDFLMGDDGVNLPLRKKLLHPREVARIIGRELDYVRELVEAGRLEAHQDSAFGERKSNRITRRSVALYLAETAAYEPGALGSRVAAMVESLGHPELDVLEARIALRRKRLAA
jgi:hypothetical protein